MKANAQAPPIVSPRNINGRNEAMPATTAMTRLRMGPSLSARPRWPLPAVYVFLVLIDEGEALGLPPCGRKAGSVPMHDVTGRVPGDRSRHGVGEEALRTSLAD